eukprot:NODE_6_length_48303_cov_0.387022.p18 type:complete len:181 gc:universal NODE_6_length_48303_cov_0.387022:9589-9047(-)
MQFVIPNSNISWKQVLCYYGAFFQNNNCKGPDSSVLVIYYSEKPTSKGIQAPFAVDDFLEVTINLADKYNIPILHQDHSPKVSPKQFGLGKKVVIVNIDSDSSFDSRNNILLRPSISLVKRDSDDSKSANDDFIDVSSSFSFFIFTLIGLIVAFIIGIQLLSSAAPNTYYMASGSRLKSD